MQYFGQAAQCLVNFILLCCVVICKAENILQVVQLAMPLFSKTTLPRTLKQSF